MLLYFNTSLPSGGFFSFLFTLVVFGWFRDSQGKYAIWGVRKGSLFSSSSKQILSSKGDTNPITVFAGAGMGLQILSNREGEETSIGF